MVSTIFNKRSTCFIAYFTSLTSSLQMGETHVLFHLLPCSILTLFNISTHTLLQHTHFPPALSSLIHLSKEEFMLAWKHTSPLNCPGHAWIAYWDITQMLCPTSTANSARDVLCSTRGVATFLVWRRHYIKINLNIILSVMKALFPGEHVPHFGKPLSCQKALLSLGTFHWHKFS